MVEADIGGKNGLESQSLLHMDCAMEAELARLEEKIGRLAQLCITLRQENGSLRQLLLVAEQDNVRLKQKLEGAESRILAILAKIPEEA